MITGTIQSIAPTQEGSYQSSYGHTIYTFDMVVNTPSGEVKGEIGSKSQVYPLARGSEINLEIKNVNGKNKFRKVNPKYANSAPAQAPQQAQGKPDWDKIAEGKVKCNVVCAYLSAGIEPTREKCNAWTDYIMGKAEAQPVAQPAMQPQAQQVMQDAGFELTDETDIPF